MIAAYYDGSLGTSERATIETHVSTCRRCQDGLAAMARADAAERAAAAASPVAGWRAPWKWLVPMAAAGTAFAVWLAVRPPSTESRAAPPSPSVSAPEDRAEPSIGTRSDVALNKSASHEDDTKSAKPSAQPALPPSRVVVERKAEASTTTLAESQPPVGALAKEAAASEADRPFSLNAKLDDRDERTPITSPPAPPRAARQEEARAKVAPAPMAEAMSAPADKLGARESISENRLGQQTVVELSAQDASTRWRLELDGSISRSRDAGSTWQRQTTGSRVRLAAGSAPAPNVCWAVGSSGTMVRTTDGERWESIPSPSSHDLTTIEARSALAATITASDGRRFETADGGKTWQSR